jgi:hypothetical protein
VGSKTGFEHGANTLILPGFPADKVVRINSRAIHRRTQRREGDRFEQGRLAVTVVGKQQVDVWQPGLGNPRGREILIRVTEGDSTVPKSPEVLNFDLINVHGAFLFVNFLPSSC